MLRSRFFIIFLSAFLLVWEARAIPLMPASVELSEERVNDTREEIATLHEQTKIKITKGYARRQDTTPHIYLFSRVTSAVPDYFPVSRLILHCTFLL